MSTDETNEQNIIDFFKKDRFCAYNGIELIKVEPGYAVSQMKITDNHLNGVGIVQGGALFTLADFAFAAASNSYGTVTVSVNATISYLKSPKGKVITAEAREVSSSRRLCTYNIDIFDEDKTLVAKIISSGYKKDATIVFDKSSEA